MLIFTNGKLFIDGEWLEFLDLIIEDGKIVNIVKSRSSYDRGKVIDANGCYITPGFIDIHIHGANGADTMDASPEALETMSNFLASKGTTSYLPTTMTQGIDTINKAVKNIDYYMHNKNNKGAEVLGAHLEGPFINRLAKGSHDERYILGPSIEAYDAITEGCHGDVVRLVTMAPEINGAEELVNYLKDKGIIVSIGHTKADYDTTMKAIDNGMTHICHFYNAMAGLNHRGPGTVGAVFDNDAATIQLISDLVHVHPAALRLAADMKGPNRTVLITDALSATGIGEGKIKWGDTFAYVKDGAMRLDNGTLAGSILTLDQALRNMVSIGIPLGDVIPMLTSTPAREIGVDSYKGKLSKGYDADIVLMDNTLSIKNVFVKGRKYR